MTVEGVVVGVNRVKEGGERRVNLAGVFISAGTGCILCEDTVCTVDGVLVLRWQEYSAVAM